MDPKKALFERMQAAVDKHERLFNQKCLENPHYYGHTAKTVWYESGELVDYKSSMEFWWPLVKCLEGVNKPATYLVPISPLDAYTIGAGDNPELYAQCCTNIQKLAQVYIQPDRNYFIRSYYHSAKHERKIGHVNTNTPFFIIMELIKEIFESSLMKDIPVSGLAFREYIELEHNFIAFNGLKIAKEMRAVIKDGTVKLIPYWPEYAMQFFKEEPKGWQQELKQLMTFSKEDKLEIVRQARILSKPLLKHHDFWTVDFAKGVDGKYYFIDAAIGETSWLGDSDSYLEPDS